MTEKMIVSKLAAQGDVTFRRIDKLPEGVTLAPVKDDRIVVAHSETGHHHTVDGTGLEFHQPSDNALICYLRCEQVSDVRHHRDFDTHATFALEPGLWEVRRQREYTPQGFRRVED